MIEYVEEVCDQRQKDLRSTVLAGTCGLPITSGAPQLLAISQPMGTPVPLMERVADGRSLRIVSEHPANAFLDLNHSFLPGGVRHGAIGE